MLDLKDYKAPRDQLAHKDLVVKVHKVKLDHKVQLMGHKVPRDQGVLKVCKDHRAYMARKEQMVVKDQ